jgi:hypothetical protein
MSPARSIDAGQASGGMRVWSNNRRSPPQRLDSTIENSSDPFYSPFYSLLFTPFIHPFYSPIELIRSRLPQLLIVADVAQTGNDIAVETTVFRFQGNLWQPFLYIEPIVHRSSLAYCGSLLYSPNVMQQRIGSFLLYHPLLTY